jgi:pimeloyl-ACP methyl ester carboxylesterase
VVDPVWLLKAVGGTIVAALVCGYLTLCLLFYQGQWQFVLHPSHTGTAPTTIDGAAVQTIHFGVDESALPQLTGWLVPTEPAARYAGYTVLYLPSGDGSLADALPTLTALHSAGINVFAFDYRGYGQSATTRPNQRRMTEDANSAWQLLTVSRALAASRIVLFGDGVGCALAAQLAAMHPEVPAIMLQLPRPDLIQAVLADPRTRSLPVHALFHERFEIAGAVAKLKTPKLFLIPEHSGLSGEGPQRLAAGAATPKMVSTLSETDFNGPAYREQVVRFLDQYLPVTAGSRLSATSAASVRVSRPLGKINSIQEQPIPVAIR